MKKELKDKFPEWCNDDSKKYELILSDDIDSLMCAVFQERKFGREIKFFIDVNYKKCSNYSNGIQMLYGFEGHTQNKSDIIALDFAMDGKTKCWDNHIVKISENDRVNVNSANLNIALDISRSNYKKKACISSFITMLSYYNIDIKEWDNEQLAILSAIDSTYYPFLTSFKETGRRNLELLDYGFLADWIINNIDLLKKVEEELNLKNGKIWINEDGYMETNIKLKELSKMLFPDYVVELPQDKIISRLKFESKYIKENITSKKDIKEKLDIDKKIFNLAMTSSRYGVISFQNN